MVHHELRATVQTEWYKTVIVLSPFYVSRRKLRYFYCRCQEHCQSDAKYRMVQENPDTDHCEPKAKSVECFTRQCSDTFKVWCVDLTRSFITNLKFAAESRRARTLKIDLYLAKLQGIVQWQFLTHSGYFSRYHVYDKNSSGDEIANVNFYAVLPEDTRIR